MKIEETLKEYGLTYEDYESLLVDCEKKINKESDLDWNEICEKYNLPWNGDSLRKGNISLVGGTFVKNYLEEKYASQNCSEDDYFEKLDRKKKELQEERIKLQTEKVEYNKNLRVKVRDEMIMDKIIEAVENVDTSMINLVANEQPNQQEKEFLLVFGDCHFGAEFVIKDLFGNIINEYSPEKFFERMNRLLSKTIDIIEKEKIETLNVFMLGDDIDGMLRVSQLFKLRYGVVDQTIKYSEYITEWLNVLSFYCNLKVQMVGGNHAELRMLGQPKGTFEDDNMGKIISSYVKGRLKDNPNIKFIENPTGFAYSQMCGFTVLAIHGDEIKGNNKAIIDQLSSLYHPIDYLIKAHYHHAISETVGINREVIGVPSIVGIDDFSFKCNKSANPGATLIVFEPLDGKTMQYDIKVD